ncbi:hypothetical protein C8R41DRAFT_591801 [Lentinula lateritia]|uniref:Remorin C-terminal domain-containing protein n=1 Tax=Lentinula lateritia TaxID=40482 RepID=A0ABQ8V3J0_9AGAR|nr:hypothetical protein C8R41DRAFT_591801 [Lentinula lateritia]
MSVVSLRTAREMHDVADLLGSTIDAPIDRPRHERAQSDETILDPSIHSPTTDDESDVDKHSTSILSPSRSRLSYASTYSQPSEFELVTADGQIERVYLPPSPSFSGFNIPRSRTSAISETPSLASSRSRSSYSSTSSHQLPPTPGIITPAEFADGNLLPVIVEKQSEGQEWSSNSSSEEISALRVSPPDTLVSSWPKQKSILRWKVPISPRRDAITEEVRRPDSPGQWSPSFFDTLTPTSQDSPTTPSPTSPSTKTSPFSLFTKREKGSRSSLTSSISSQVSQLPLDNKAMKAEEKRRRKEEAKARTERLAEQLKAKSKERARMEADNISNFSAERRKKERGAMYGGIAGVVM